MSCVTSYVLYCCTDEEGAAQFHEAIARVHGGGHAVPLSTDHTPGPKGFQGDVYGAAGNRWDTETMQELLDSVKWDAPHQVVVVCCQEDAPAEVYRPGLHAAVDPAEAFHRGFSAGRDYTLWADRSSDEATCPDTFNPYDGRDETDPEGES